jgi:hypothetical protein
MLAPEKREIQPAADGVQPQHDGICEFTGEPHVPCSVARQIAPPGKCSWIGAGDGHSVSGTDGSGGWYRRSQRGKSGGARMVELGSPCVPLLRGQRRRNLDGPGDEFAPGLGIGTRGIPRDVWNPPLLSSLLWADRRNTAVGRSGKSGRSGSVVSISEREDEVACARIAHVTFFFWASYCV